MLRSTDAKEQMKDVLGAGATSRDTGRARKVINAATLRRLLVVLLVAAGFATAATAVAAAFRGTTSNPSDSWQAATLQPPSGFTATRKCSSGVPRAVLSWTATPSTYATGYQVVRSGVGTQTITPYTTTTATDDPLANSTSYSWQLKTYLANWTSSSVNASLTTGICPSASIGAPSPTSGSVGSSVTVTGVGFKASTALTITFGTVTATITSGATTNDNGDVNATFTVPFSGNGSYPIKVSDGTNSFTSATSFTVTGSFDGIMYTGITTSGSSNCSSATIGQNTTCTASAMGATGTFTGSVTLVTTARASVTNTGAALTVTSAIATVSSPGGTATPAGSAVATGASTTGSAFQLKGNGGGWQATMTCSVTVNGVTYTVAVTGH